MKKCIVILLLAGFVTHSIAGDIHKRNDLPPEVKAKINNQRAKSYLYEGQAENYQQDSGCGDLTVGDFSNSKIPPREVIIIANDIINFNQNCR